MGFKKTFEQIGRNLHKTGEFYNAEMLTVYFEINRQTAATLLPAPLKPASMPLGLAFIARYPETNAGFAYSEGALFIFASHNGSEGVFCLSMPVDNDMALIVGRELSGFPKKMAAITLSRDANTAKGWVERHNVKFLEINARLNGSLNDESHRDFITRLYEPDARLPIYNMKYFPSPDRIGFDYNPRLIKEDVQFRPDIIEFGEADIILRSSVHDPWGDVKIERVIGAVFTKGHNTLFPGQVVAEADPVEFMPYVLMKLDSFESIETRQDCYLTNRLFL